MATKSIYNNVSIKDKNLCRNLVLALENASRKKSKEVVMSKMVKEVSKEMIKDLFAK